MNLFVNKGEKGFFLKLALILLAGILLGQVIAYINAVQLKNQLISHDYALAGYLMDKHPELSQEIPSLFTSEKSESHQINGKAVLEPSGYKNSVDLALLPTVTSLYRTNLFINLIYSLLIGLVVLLLIYRYQIRHYQQIDQYNDDIVKIMKGAAETRLADNEEGSLARLASSINQLFTSLRTHIDKEKQDRIFLKDTMVNISHQLKTPLAALSMYTEIMQAENTDNNVINSFLQKSQHEVERMQVLIANLLKLAKLDAGIIELHKDKYVLNDIVKQAMADFETKLAAEGKTFELRAENQIKYTCDKEWLLESLSNLIKNAVEHTSVGNHIQVQLEESQLLVQIRIRDNGEGIHPDDISHIFKRFYRSKFSQKKQGTGIGLNLAKSIIEMHDGFISVESSKNGTEFTIHLPKLTKV